MTAAFLLILTTLEPNGGGNYIFTISGAGNYPSYWSRNLHIKKAAQNGRLTQGEKDE